MKEIVNKNNLSDIKLKYSKQYLFFVVLFYFFIFKDPLESIIPLIGYFDELIALCALPIFFINLEKNNFTLKIHRLGYAKYLIAFLVIGFIGNIINNYQTLYYSILDAFLNVKFWLSIYVGSSLLNGFSLERNAKGIYFHCKLIILFFAALAVLEYAFGGLLGSVTYRYGILSLKLIYSHPTVLVAVCVLIYAVLISVSKYVKFNWLYVFIILLIMCGTLRVKALVAALTFIIVSILVIKCRIRIKLFVLIIIGLVGFMLAWNQIYYYFFSDVQGDSARYQLLITSFSIASDFFPFGTGFGTFASYYSGVNYSPIYSIYGINNVYGLVEGKTTFISDSFWPMILGQTGVLGLLCYVFALIVLFSRIQRLRKVSNSYYASALCVIIYILIASTSESAFVHPLAIPLALWLGCLLKSINNKF